MSLVVLVMNRCRQRQQEQQCRRQQFQYFPNTLYLSLLHTVSILITCEFITNVITRFRVNINRRTVYKNSITFTAIFSLFIFFSFCVFQSEFCCGCGCCWFMNVLRSACCYTAIFSYCVFLKNKRIKITLSTFFLRAIFIFVII